MYPPLGRRRQSPDQGSLAARIRASRIVPYQAVIGPREAAEDKVALRLRDGRRFDAQPADDILRRIADRIRTRGADLWDAPN
jgi:threonyl-tRNA synthetase